MWQWIIRSVIDHKWAITVLMVIHLLVCLFLVLDPNPVYFVITMAYFPTTGFLELVFPPVSYVLGALLFAIFGLIQWLLVLCIYAAAKRAVCFTVMAIRNGGPQHQFPK